VREYWPSSGLRSCGPPLFVAVAFRAILTLVLTFKQVASHTLLCLMSDYGVSPPSLAQPCGLRAAELTRASCAPAPRAL